MGNLVCQNVYDSYPNNGRMPNISFLETAAARAGSGLEVSSFPVVLTTLKNERMGSYVLLSMTLAALNTL